MTITYKLLGIPKTLDEFVDKAKQRGNNKIEVNVSTQEDLMHSLPFGYGPRFTRFYVYTRLEKKNLVLEEFQHANFSDLYTNTIWKTETKYKAFKKAIKISEQLKESGLEVTINDYSIEEMKLLLVKQYEILKESSKKYNVCLLEKYE